MGNVHQEKLTIHVCPQFDLLMPLANAGTKIATAAV
jgi:hypothetical protein